MIKNILSEINKIDLLYPFPLGHRRFLNVLLKRWTLHFRQRPVASFPLAEHSIVPWEYRKANLHIQYTLPQANT